MSRIRTLRASLMLGYAAVVLVVAGLLFAITFLGARSRAEAQSTLLMQRAMRQAKENLDGFFGPVVRSTALVRGWAEKGTLSARDPAAMERLVEPLLNQIDSIAWVEVGEEGAARLRLTRAGLQEGRGTRSWSAGEEITWVKTQDPGAAWGSLEADASYRLAGGRRGVVGIGVDLDRISDFTRALQVTEHALALVMIEAADTSPAEREFQVIGLPRDACFESESARQALCGKPARELGIRSVNDAVAAAQERGGDLAEPIPFETGGQTWWLDIDTYALGDRELLVAILIPQDDLMGDRTALRWWILAGSGLALLFSLIFAAWLAQRAGDPIRKLVRESERMREGDFSAGEPVATNIRELRRLAEAHNEMRTGLASLMKMQRDIQVARKIQQATFPSHVPQLPGYQLAGTSRPADDTGGDSYDLIGVRAQAGSGRWKICDEGAEQVICLLADATGHGIGPALSVAQLRAMVRMAVRVMESPEGLARHINEQLEADLPPGRFISAWIGRLDPATNAVTGLSAGQGPIWHYRAAADSFESLGSQMPPYGLFRNPAIASDITTPLAPGDLFIVLSDGFHEAVGPAGELFEEERVQEVLRSHAARAPDEILAALHKAVDAFTGGLAPDDDRTAVLIKRDA